MDERQLKLECYRASGNLTEARELYAWLRGETVPTPVAAEEQIAEIAQARDYLEQENDLHARVEAQGRMAYHACEKFESNPFSSATLRKHWARGWCAAQLSDAGHSSDCALHNLPAFEPLPCTCGAFSSDLTADEAATINPGLSELKPGPAPEAAGVDHAPPDSCTDEDVFLDADDQHADDCALNQSPDMLCTCKRWYLNEMGAV